MQSIDLPIKIAKKKYTSNVRECILITKNTHLLLAFTVVYSHYISNKYNVSF